MTPRRAKILLAGLIVVLLGLTGCGISDKYSQPYQDAPRSGVKSTNPADVVTMPDGFSNLTSKCDNGNRIYVAYHGNSAYAAVAVVPQDPSCK